MTMTGIQIDTLLGKLLRREPVPLDPPTEADWRVLETRFGCRFGEDFQAFIVLMSKYQFPGEILNVSRGKTNGNDSILIAYECEMTNGRWNPEMIPFYAIGNGDYCCLRSTECPQSRVFYHAHERAAFEANWDSLADWLLNLPVFLA